MVTLFTFIFQLISAFCLCTSVLLFIPACKATTAEKNYSSHPANEGRRGGERSAIELKDRRQLYTSILYSTHAPTSHSQWITPFLSKCNTIWPYTRHTYTRTTA